MGHLQAGGVLGVERLDGDGLAGQRAYQGPAGLRRGVAVAGRAAGAPAAAGDEPARGQREQRQTEREGDELEQSRGHQGAGEGLPPGVPPRTVAPPPRGGGEGGSARGARDGSGVSPASR